MAYTIARYGWRPDLPDARDQLFEKISAPVALPPSVSLRAKMPPVFDQGQLGSCTANSLCAAFAFEHGGGPYSRLQLYFDERTIEGDPQQDNGAQIRDGVKSLASTGVAPEAVWPYDITKFAEQPTANVYAAAAMDKVMTYNRLVSGTDFHQCLAQGYPFVIGFTVYESFEGPAVAQNGIVSMPAPSERAVGGHAVCVIGYDDGFNRNGASGSYYEVRNSWGLKWGDQGNFWMPAAYFESANLADDAWTLRS